MLERLKKLIAEPPLKVRPPEALADAVERTMQAIGRSRRPPVAAAVLLATGAGLAFWRLAVLARDRTEGEGPAGEP